MKTGVRKLLALVLTIAVCMSNMVTVSANGGTENTDNSVKMNWEDVAQEDNDEEDYDDEDMDYDEEDDSEDCSVDNMLDIEYHITAKWDKHYNVDVTLKNVSDSIIENWEICFDLEAEIENIWNATITDHEDDEYVIKNAGWNQDIKEGGTVTFGMTIKCDNDLEFPTNCYLTRELVEVENGYSIQYKEDSRWDNFVNGRIIITNESDKVIEDWKLDVTINNLESFDNLWNAKLISNDKKGSFSFNNAEYNQNIPAGQSIEFGFIAKCSGAIKIVASTLYEMSDNFYYDDGNYINKDDLNGEVVYNSEDFDSYEEYLQFLQENNINQFLDMTTKERSRKVASKPIKRDALINTYFQFYKVNGELIQDAGEVKATQSFVFDDNGVYTIHANRGNEKQNCYLSLGNESPFGYEIKQDKYVKMINFAHGQTFEKLSLGKSSTNKYFMFSGKSNQYTVKGKKPFTKWATEICFVKCNKINKELKRDKAELQYSTKKSGTIRRIININCANKEGKSRGIVKRVDGALSANTKVLVIWCQMADGGIQVSLYDMTPIKKFITRKKGTFSLHSKTARNACIASYYQERVKDNGNTALRPSNSFQSIEVSNKLVKDKKTDPDQYNVYICGGNELDNEELQVSRFTVKKGKTGMYSKRRIIVNPKTRSDDNYNIEENNREIEGCHIIGKDLVVLIAHSKTKGQVIKKDLQYICRIKKADINKEAKY